MTTENLNTWCKAQDAKRTPFAKFDYRYTMATIEATCRLDNGKTRTVDQCAQEMGMRQGEPLIVMLDCLLQYALVYQVRYGGPLATDQLLGDHWRDALKAVHGLLNGDGVVAMQRNITTDSKSNGACEEVYWKAIEAAGFKESDL